MTDPVALATIVAAFLIAGTVKGVVGLGLPTIALALMTFAIGLPQAMAVLIVPSLATNIWQASVGGRAGAILRRHWPFFAAAMLAVAPGAALLVRLDPTVPLVLLALLLIAYGSAGLGGFRPHLSPARQRWAGPLTGTVNGLATGLTGSFAFPGAFYLQAVGLPRNALVQAMGILFTASTAALALALGGHGRLDPGLAALSAGAVIPALLGMVLGRRLRTRLAEATFRRLFHMALMGLGVAILIRAAL